MRPGFQTVSVKRRLRGNIGAVFLSLLLPGCTATGARFEELRAKLESPPSDKVRLIVFREASFMGAARSPTIRVNGYPVCDLPNGSFFSVDVDPGEVLVSSETWDLPGVSSTSIVTKPRSLAYVRFRVETGRIVGGMFGGLIGYGIGAAASGSEGPFIFEVVEKNIAEESLKSLKAANCS